MLLFVASSLVETRCGGPMRKSHSTVSSNAPNQTDRNSSTKFHWTYCHNVCLSPSTCWMWLAYFPYCDSSYSSDQCEILDLGIMDHRFQVYSSDLTKGGEVAFHHGRRIPEGKILEHLSSWYSASVKSINNRTDKRFQKKYGNKNAPLDSSWVGHERKMMFLCSAFLHLKVPWK